MTENTFYLLSLFLIICFISWVIYYGWFRSTGYKHSRPDIVLDGRDEENIIEAGSVVEQRKSGRERGGMLYLFRDRRDPPKTIEGQLNLKSFEESEEWTKDF